MIEERAPYGHRSKPARNENQLPFETMRALSGSPYRGETYYGRPAVKATTYHWLITLYLFIGGLAGTAQMISALADLGDHQRNRSIVRAGRYLGCAGALLSPALLIADLHTPSRWYNMLRMFRGTSPMSIGSWVLFAFGGLSTLAAFAQFVEDVFTIRVLRSVGRLAGIAALPLSAIMATYTGALLAATSIPLWASAFKYLPALFGVSSMTSAFAALSLLIPHTAREQPVHRKLERLALVSGAAELIVAALLEKQWNDDHVSEPIRHAPYSWVYRSGFWGAALIAPLVLHSSQVFKRKPSPVVSALAAWLTCIGGFALRIVLVFSGNASAGRARDYFEFTQPQSTHEVKQP